MHTEEIKEVLFAEQNGVGIITLNRPEALNALNNVMFHALYAKLSEWEFDDNIKAVIIEGAGDRAFCAGGDVRAAAELGAGNDQISGILKAEYRFNHKVYGYPKPYIALIDGIVMGGGVGASVYGKYRIATETTKFSMPECAIGFFPDVGMGYGLSRCPNCIGMYLGLTASHIGLADCMELGFFTHHVLADKLLEVRAAIIDNPDNIDKILASYSQAIENQGEVCANHEAINRCFSKSTVEEIIIALKAEGTEWANETLEAISKMSPFSLKLSLRQQQLAKNMSFTDEISMEYQMVKTLFKRNDFYEGVRAMLVDRDNSPKWQPATLEEVSDIEVQECFEVSDKNDILLDI